MAYLEGSFTRTIKLTADWLVFWRIDSGLFAEQAKYDHTADNAPNFAAYALSSFCENIFA